MKTLTRISFVLFGISCCFAGDTFKTSKVVDSKTIGAILRGVSNRFQMKPVESAGSGIGGIFRARLESDVLLECNDRTRRSFVADFRTATQKLLRDQGATIHGWEAEGPDDDLRGFSWEYSWGPNNGLIVVRYHPNGAEKGSLSILCYEHIRGVPAPPRAKGY